MSAASVSIIIPNKNSSLIDKTLASLFQQTSFDLIEEILVVGVDEPGLVVERGPVRFIRTATPVSAPVARNIGIRQAVGQVLVFIDSDCVADSNWLASLLSAYASRPGVIGGSVSFPPVPYYQLCYNLTMFHDFLPDLPSGTRLNLGTLNLLVPRPVLDQVGPLDETLVRCQDTEWTLRMRLHGNQLYFAPQAVVSHLPHVTSFSQIMKLWYLTGFYSGQIRRKYRQLISPPPFSRLPILLILFSPFIGAVVAARIFLRNLRLLRYIHTFPVIFLTKVVWCWGAARQSLQAH